jgi:hypothetical protein
VQSHRADLIREQDHLHLPGARRPDEVGEPRQVGFVFAVHRDGHEFQCGRIGLVQKDQRIVNRRVATAFAQLQFHIVDQQIEILHIPRHHAGQDRRWFRLQSRQACHRL